MGTEGLKKNMCAFDLLFTRNVLHIQEKIFFSLDYNSFKTCLEVNNTWNELLTKESFQERARIWFKKEILDDKRYLEDACYKGKADEVRKLISSGILDLNYLFDTDWCIRMNRSVRSTLLCTAVNEGHKEVVKILLNGGADCNKPDKDGCTPLHLAARYGNGDVVRIILDSGAEPNGDDRYRCTPLHIAAECGFEGVANMLLDAQAEIEKTCSFGQTPLHIAVLRNQHNMVKLLLDNGASLTMRDAHGMAPIHIAVNRCQWEWCNHKVVNVLLEAGANINQADSSGQTPLHYATFQYQRDIVKLLLDNGADPNKANAQGVSPIQVAADRDPVFKMLLDANGGRYTEIS